MKCPECKVTLLNPSSCGECGWTRQKKQKEKTVPPWPRECMVTDCENDTNIVWVLARDEMGREVYGHGSRFLYRTGGNTYERYGYEFIEWVTRCSACYIHELDMKGKSNIGVPEKILEDPEFKKGFEERPRNRSGYTPGKIENEQELLEAAATIGGGN